MIETRALRGGARRANAVAAHQVPRNGVVTLQHWRHREAEIVLPLSFLISLFHSPVDIGALQNRHVLLRTATSASYCHKQLKTYISAGAAVTAQQVTATRSANSARASMLCREMGVWLLRLNCKRLCRAIFEAKIALQEKIPS